MRYTNRRKYTNSDERIKDLLKNRGVNFIEHYDTPELKYPSIEEMEELEIASYVWKVGDRLYKIANKYYDDPKLWWVIAWFNQKPTEGFIEVGETINIPLPLEKIMQFLGY